MSGLWRFSRKSYTCLGLMSLFLAGCADTNAPQVVHYYEQPLYASEGLICVYAPATQLPMAFELLDILEKRGLKAQLTTRAPEDKSACPRRLQMEVIPGSQLQAGMVTLQYQNLRTGQSLFVRESRFATPASVVGLSQPKVTDPKEVLLDLVNRLFPDRYQ